MPSKEFGQALEAIETNDKDLFIACVESHPAIVHEKEPKALYTLLHYAVQGTKSNILDYLVKHLSANEMLGETILSLTQAGDTVVHTAALMGSARHLQILFNADYEAAAKASRWPNNNGKTPLDLLNSNLMMNFTDYYAAVNLLEGAMLHYDFKPLFQPIRIEDVVGEVGEDAEILGQACEVASHIRLTTKYITTHPIVRNFTPDQFQIAEDRLATILQKRLDQHIQRYSYWDAALNAQELAGNCHGMSTRFAHKLSSFNSRLKVQICSFTDATGDHVWNVVNDIWIVDTWAGEVFHKSYMSSKLRDLTVLSELRHGFEKPVILFANLNYHVIETNLTLYPIRCPRVMLAESSQSKSKVSKTGVFAKGEKSKALMDSKPKKAVSLTPGLK